MIPKFQSRYKQLLNEAPQRVIPPYHLNAGDREQLNRVGFIAQTYKQYARTLIWKYPDNAKFESWMMKICAKTDYHDLNALGKVLAAMHKKYYLEKINLYQSVYEATVYAADMMNLFVSKEHTKYHQYLKSLNKDNPGVPGEY